MDSRLPNPYSFPPRKKEKGAEGDSPEVARVGTLGWNCPGIRNWVAGLMCWIARSLARLKETLEKLWHP